MRKGKFKETIKTSILDSGPQFTCLNVGQIWDLKNLQEIHMS